MAKSFLTEREGQQQFFDKFGILDTDLANNTDGVYKGTLFEFKKTIPNINVVLFQAIKYLSHMRVKGESIPSNILLVALNEEIAYLFNSKDYIEEIEKIYAGAASKNNSNFIAQTPPKTIRYDSPEGIYSITQILQDESYTKINIDVFDVVGWAERFYREKPFASKINLFEELRDPKHFNAFIYPWKGSERDFKYIMDLLNDKQHKKELGAFYTPSAYCLKSTELVRKAIGQVPQGNDYIILDRCAGTGNLEEFLTDKDVNNISLSELNKYINNDFKKQYLASVADGVDLILSKNEKTINNITLGDLKKYETSIKIREFIFDNELSHTIVNTYELKEWIVLNERLGDRVKLIIPPPQEIDSTKPLVEGGDALSSRFVSGQKSIDMTQEYSDSINMLLDYVRDEKNNIILLENPPFRDETSNAHMKGKSSSSFVKTEMKKEIKGSVLNDLSNQFIWSGWKYFLKKPNDSYVLFSPIKYWKSLNLAERHFVEGFLFNRFYFHAGSSAIACILWHNIPETRETIRLSVFDINNKKTPEPEDDEIVFVEEIEVKKVHNLISKLYDKRDDKSDTTDGIVCGLDGVEDKIKESRVIKKFNKNIIGYLVVQQFGFGNPRLATNLTRCAIYNGNGFFLRSDNYIEKLPLFAAGKMPVEKNWILNGTIFKTSDGGEKYLNDKDFLKSCFIFTCLSYYNKCRSLDGSDGRFYKNELCFDLGTIASEKLKDFKLSDEEKDLCKIFSNILEKAKETSNYNSKYSYGTFQIDVELNTRKKNENDEWVYDYPHLNTDINSLKTKLAKYYQDIIQPKLFEYELLK